MALLSDIRTEVANAVRDTTNATFSTAEMNYYINRGIDAVSDIFPLETTDYSIALVSGVSTYAPSVTFSQIFRVDIHSNSDSYLGVLPFSLGEGRQSGWEFHAGILWIPPLFTFPSNAKIRLWGYSRYAQLAADSATTDMSRTAIDGVIAYCASEALSALMMDRAKFQQWQVNSNNTDVTALTLAQLAARADLRWKREQQRLRRLRRLG